MSGTSREIVSMYKQRIRALEREVETHKARATAREKERDEAERLHKHEYDGRVAAQARIEELVGEGVRLRAERDAANEREEKALKYAATVVAARDDHARRAHAMTRERDEANEKAEEHREGANRAAAQLAIEAQRREAAEQRAELDRQALADTVALYESQERECEEAEKRAEEAEAAFADLDKEHGQLALREAKATERVRKLWGESEVYIEHRDRLSEALRQYEERECPRWCEPEYHEHVMVSPGFWCCNGCGAQSEDASDPDGGTIEHDDDCSWVQTHTALSTTPPWPASCPDCSHTSIRDESGHSPGCTRSEDGKREKT